MATLAISTILIIYAFLVLVHGRTIREVPDPHEIPDDPNGGLENGFLTPSHPVHWTVDSLLPEDYNRLVPPVSKDKAVEVRIALNITQLLSIREDEQVSRNKSLKVCINSISPHFGHQAH